MKRCRVQLQVLLISLVLQVSVEGLNGFRLCGRELADALAMVCSDHGYNMAFSRSDYEFSFDRRQRRGIVDECCHSGCNLEILQSYCRSDDSSTADTPPEKLEIRKRSEDENNLKRQGSDYILKETSDGTKYQYKHNDLNGGTPESVDMKNDGTHHHKRRLFAHSDDGAIDPSHEISTQRSPKTKRNHKVTMYDRGFRKTDINSPDSAQQLSSMEKNTFHSKNHDRFPTIRHQRYKFTKKHRKNELRIKKGKDILPSQVGTVSPYFLGRTLVSKSSRKSFVPHI